MSKAEKLLKSLNEYIAKTEEVGGSRSGFSRP